MKKLLLFIGMISLSFSTTFMPYFSYIDYSKSLKDYGVIGGIYSSWFDSPYKSEIDGEFLDLEYKDSTPTYYQTDLTFLEHYYIGYNYEIHGGIHNIFISQKKNSEHYQNVLILGALYYQYLKYNMGFDIYYSTYKNFNVTQLTPKIGFNFGNYYSTIGSFYAEAKINYINISDKNAAETNKDTYLDSDFKISNFQGPWTTTLKFSFGKNAYKVADGGFVVYNLGEEYKYSYGVDVNYALNKKESLKISFSRSSFNEDGNNCDSNVFVLSYITSF